MSGKDDEVGLTSIRLGGRSLEELTPFEYAHVREQLPDYEKTQAENEIAAIKARYPRPSIAYVDSRIKEARENLLKIASMKERERARVAEYNVHIGLCAQRDNMIAALHPLDDIEHIRLLRKQFPPYDVEALRQQIVQCEESIKRCEDIAQQENDSIAALSEVRVLCQERDKELRKLGAVVE